MKKENIINYETMGGWPICKITLRDFIKEIGGKLNEETGKWEIDESDALDVFPVKLNDDGMGYGVNEEYFTCVNFGADEHFGKYCNVFTEEKLENIEVWDELKAFPGISIDLGEGDDKGERVLLEIINEGDGKEKKYVVKAMYGEKLEKTDFLPFDVVKKALLGEK